MTLFPSLANKQQEVPFLSLSSVPLFSGVGLNETGEAGVDPLIFGCSQNDLVRWLQARFAEEEKGSHRKGNGHRETREVCFPALATGAKF